MKALFVIILMFALFIESSLTTLPLVLLVLLSLSAIFKQNFIFVLSFIFGIFLDLLSLQTVGLSSIFFIVFVYLILLYQSKLEIATYGFIIAASFIGSLFYLIITGSTSSLILQPIVSAVIGLIIFIAIGKLFPFRKSHE